MPHTYRNRRLFQSWNENKFITLTMLAAWWWWWWRSVFLFFFCTRTHQKKVKLILVWIVCYEDVCARSSVFWECLMISVCVCVWISMFSMSERPLEVYIHLLLCTYRINGAVWTACCMPPAAASHLKLMSHMFVFGIPILVFNFLVRTAIWHSNAPY